MQNNEGAVIIPFHNDPYTRRSRSIYTWLLCNAQRRFVLKEIGHVIAVMVHSERPDFSEYYRKKNEISLKSTYIYAHAFVHVIYWTTVTGNRSNSPCHVCFMPLQRHKLTTYGYTFRCSNASHDTTCLYCGSNYKMSVHCPVAKSFLKYI